MSFDDTPGFKDVVLRFGTWPTFHDAEVVQLRLDRDGPSVLRILTGADGQTAIVKFVLDQVWDISLAGFNHQNVIARLEVEVATTGATVTLFPCFGLSGHIKAESLRVELEEVPNGRGL